MRCELCGHEMRPVDGSDKTTRTGTWYVLRCENCCHEVWELRPRRKK